jgi:hypothetical protein
MPSIFHQFLQHHATQVEYLEPIYRYVTENLERIKQNPVELFKDENLFIAELAKLLIKISVCRIF